ncbi:MAG: flagellar motor switch protein FliN, partial [Lachnospiraceae bacterium]|nr:flagellar motor switch protein FliN [Lachnospiraceae bacterium]
SFRMEIGDLVDSEIMQLYPYSFVREMCSAVTSNMQADANDAQIGIGDSASAPAPAPEPAPAASPMGNPMGAPQQGQMYQAGPYPAGPYQGQPYPAPTMMDPSMYGQPVQVQPAQFTPFTGDFAANFAKENIDLIMDVPLEVTVELGRTSKSIQEILDFTPGTIVELNKIAGEPIDILVNGKYVAKGEVVVIEESFGVRITEIVK